MPRPKYEDVLVFEEQVEASVAKAESTRESSSRK